MRSYLKFGIFIIVVLIGGGALYLWHSGGIGGTAAAAQFKTSQEASSVYVRFDMEAYDDIQSDYWQQVSDAQLAQLFQASLQKAQQNLSLSGSATLSTTTRDATAQMLSQAFSGLSTTTEDQLALQTVDVALYNLAPNGRDNLLSSQAQTQLQNTVNNVQPGSDLYSDLGLQDGASSSAVQQAVVAQTAMLAATTSAAGQQQLAQVQKAAATLENPTAKSIYDQTGAQATVFSHVLNSHTLYIDISSIAPSTIDEFGAAVDAASTTPSLDQLVIDLRGNIGGDLSFAQDFLALFYGPNEYGFDLFHQGNLDVQRTANIAQDPTLSQFKQIAVLTDSMTQSTAELTASALKHDRLAYTVGTTTRGWGSVETILPMQTVIDPSETYALELVEYLTVRYDGLPIEGNGVAPDVDVNQSGWQSELPTYFSSSYMQQGIKSAILQPPMQ